MADQILTRLQAAALAYAEAARHTQRFFDRITDTDDPAVLAEYATLAEREKLAFADRLDAIEAAGFEVPSIDQSDPDR